MSIEHKNYPYFYEFGEDRSQQVNTVTVQPEIDQTTNTQKVWDRNPYFYEMPDLVPVGTTIQEEQTGDNS